MTELVPASSEGPQEVTIDPSIAETEAHFDALLAAAKNGDRIVFPCDGFQEMFPHPHGVLIKVGSSTYTYRLNGVREIYRGRAATQTEHPDGILFELRSGDRSDDVWLLLNGETLLFAGIGDKTAAHARGAVVRTPDGITLNGTRMLVAQSGKDWVAIHPEGVLIKKDTDEGIPQLLLNGERVVHEGAWDKVLTDDRGWTVLIAGSLNFSRFTSTALGVLYEGPYSECFLHPQGVVIRMTKGGKDRFLLNGKTVLYDVAAAAEPMRVKAVHDHPHGIVIELRKVGASGSDPSTFLLNGSVMLYEGEYDTVVMHPQGMLVRKGQKVFLSVYKSFNPDQIDVV